MKNILYLFAIITAIAISYCGRATLGSCLVTLNDSNSGEWCFQYLECPANMTFDDFDEKCVDESGECSKDNCKIKNPVGMCEYEIDGCKAQAQFGEGFDLPSAKAFCDSNNGKWK